LTWTIVLLGLVIGAISGVVGIGGGILFVPALIWLLGMDQLKAQGTSLGALLAPVGLLAFIEYYRKGHAICVLRCCWQSDFWWAATLARWAQSIYQCSGCGGFLLSLWS
jgi:hypothetical protein